MYLQLDFSVVSFISGLQALENSSRSLLSEAHLVVSPLPYCICLYIPQLIQHLLHSVTLMVKQIGHSDVSQYDHINKCVCIIKSYLVISNKNITSWPIFVANVSVICSIMKRSMLLEFILHLKLLLLCLSVFLVFIH